MAFDPDKYLAQTAPQANLDAGFDPDAYLAQAPARDVAGEQAAPEEGEAEIPPEKQVGGGRAALVGAGQGATFGFADELTAPVAAAINDPKSLWQSIKAGGKALVGAEPTLEELQGDSKYGQDMQAYRDVAREEQKAAQEQHPIAYGTGMVAGGLAAPGLGAGAAMNATKGMGLLARAGTGSVVGAGMGALGGLGEAEGSLEERLPQAYESAKTGAAIGAAIPVAGAAINATRKLAKASGELPVISETSGAFREGQKGNKLYTKKGQKEASDALSKVSGNLVEDVKGLSDDIGKKIGQNVEDANAAGKTLDLSDDVSTVLEKLKIMKNEGSEDARKYAANLEAEIKRILNIKDVEAPTFMGKAADELPEGFIIPKGEAATDLTKVTPKQAQELQMSLRDMTNTKNPFEVRAAAEGRGFRNKVTDKLGAETGNNAPTLDEAGEVIGGSLNDQYKTMQEAITRLKARAKGTELEEQVNERVNNMVSQLEKSGKSGNADRAIEQVLERIKSIPNGGEELAAKYAQDMSDAVSRNNLGQQIAKGTNFSFATPKAAVLAASNAAGLGARKIAPALQAAGKAGTVASNLAQSNAARKAAIRVAAQQGTEAERQGVRDIAQAQKNLTTDIGNANPELISDQANYIRDQYGDSGESLANELEKMAGADKVQRQRLMFSVLQNKAYRQMLGVKEENVK